MALLGHSGFAPNSKALANISSPSDPFKPTLPPIPATGLIIIPIFLAKISHPFLSILKH